MELISIGREDFYEIFMSNRGQEPEHIKYLRECPIMREWPIHVLLEHPTACLFHYYKYRKCFYLNKKKELILKLDFFRRGQVVVQNSIITDYIYIIKSVKI